MTLRSNDFGTSPVFSRLTALLGQCLSSIRTKKAQGLWSIRTTNISKVVVVRQSPIRIPPKLTVLIQPRQPSIADWQDLVRAGATWNDKPRNAPPQYRIVSYA